MVIPILYEDRSVLAIDKPAGWLLAPDSWDHTARNLQLALISSMNAGDFWASSRNLRYLRYIHRLDAETSGALLFAKSPGALSTYSRLFEGRQIEKRYLAVVRGIPAEREWDCRLAIAPDPRTEGKMRTISPRGSHSRAADGSGGGRPAGLPLDAKEAETHFELLEAGRTVALVRATPTTGRTHQIRVHLAATGHPVVGDLLYGPPAEASRAGAPPPIRDRPRHLPPSRSERPPMALRAVELAYVDPFSHRRVRITASDRPLLEQFKACDQAPAASKSRDESAKVKPSNEGNVAL